MVVSICSFADVAPAPPPPISVWAVIQEWGYNWLWEDLQIVGLSDWLATAIANGTCKGVTDGWNVCSATFFFKNEDRTCQLVGSFAEPSDTANAYRGELLGLMTLHLILLAVNKVTHQL